MSKYDILLELTLLIAPLAGAVLLVGLVITVLYIIYLVKSRREADRLYRLDADRFNEWAQEYFSEPYDEDHHDT